MAEMAETAAKLAAIKKKKEVVAKAKKSMEAGAPVKFDGSKDSAEKIANFDPKQIEKEMKEKARKTRHVDRTSSEFLEGIENGFAIRGSVE